MPAHKFWDRMANRYAKSPVKDEQSYQHKLAITQQHLTKEMNILEVGCGTGTTAIKHAPHVNHIHAIDFSEEMLTIAKEKAKQANVDNISFKQSDIETLQVESNSIDVVLTLSLLHLIEDKQTAIAKIYNMIKPGGLFISSTTCLAESSPLLKYVFPLICRTGLLPPIKVFNKEELIQAMQEIGFTIEYQWQPGKGKAIFIIAKKPNN